jgi:SAM-dependent methyltransferase
LNPRKAQILEHANRIAAERAQWIARNSAYYDDDRNFMRFLVPKGSQVLDLGCGTGDLLASLAPAHGVGVDLSPNMIALARQNHPNLTFHVGDIENPVTLANIQGPFDTIILSDTNRHAGRHRKRAWPAAQAVRSSTRVIIAYYSRLWEPVLTFVEWLGLRMPQPPLNYLVNNDFLNIHRSRRFRADQGRVSPARSGAGCSASER